MSPTFVLSALCLAVWALPVALIAVATYRVIRTILRDLGRAVKRAAAIAITLAGAFEVVVGYLIHKHERRSK